MIENEVKLMLTAQQYRLIRSKYPWDKVIAQTNHYYDTDNLSLTPCHITCRVRELSGENLLQIKLPNGAAYSRIELEKRIGASVPEQLPAELLNSLAGEYLDNPLPDVKRLGSLTTERCIKHFDGAEIDLDKSTYFAVTDFELEIEFTDETVARKLLKEIKEAAGITESAEVCSGKVHRFLSLYKQKSMRNE